MIIIENRGGKILRRIILCLAVLSLLSAGAPATAQEYTLFDKFNLKLEGSWVKLNTVMRIDSEILGIGASLNFENDFNLGNDEIIPSLSFEWQMKPKHQLGFRWQRINRSSSTQLLTEIQVGDYLIPIDAQFGISFEIETYAVDYTYYPWIKDRWAAGFGLGLRVLDLVTVFSWDYLELEADGTVTAPLPYVYFEYRHALSEKWHFKAGLGWLYVSIKDISGGQRIGRLSIEHRTFNNIGFGAALNYSAIDVKGDGKVFLGRVDLDIHDISVFARINF